MSDRSVHLVGSIPAASTEAAMDLAMSRLGPFLRTMSDGETGARDHWVKNIIEGLRRHPDVELVHDGDWSSYDRIPRFRVRRGHRLIGATLDLEHVAATRAGAPVLDALRAAHGRPDVAYLTSVPGDLDLALFTFGPGGALRHRRAFTEATVRELHEQHALLGDGVVFQIEVPAEVTLLAGLPAAAQPAAAAGLARGIARLVAAAPAGARFGVHLCLGDMNNRALGRLRDVSPLVHLVTALARRWPTGRPWEFLHVPLAAGERPAPLDPAFYAPLSRLRLPHGVRFVAGFVHELASGDDLLRLRDMLDAQLGAPVDVAAACGLGRRSPQVACALMDRMAALCVEPVGAATVGPYAWASVTEDAIAPAISS